jgi:hypothetical protein
MSTTTKAKTAMGETLAMQVALTHLVANANLEGVTHAESVAQPQPGGNCLNWILGHVVSARSNALALVGREPIWDEDRGKAYQRHGPPLADPAQALPFEELLADFNRIQDGLLEGLAEVSEETLAQKAPFSPTNNPDETIGSLLAGLVFHEAYHVGQMGLGRRIAGKAALGL